MLFTRPHKAWFIQGLTMVRMVGFLTIGTLPYCTVI